MNKMMAKLAFGIVLLFLGFNLVNKSLEAKYGTLNEFIDIPIINTGMSINREGKNIKLVLFNKKLRLPSIIEFPNPLLRK